MRDPEIINKISVFYQIEWVLGSIRSSFKFICKIWITMRVLPSLLQFLNFISSNLSWSNSRFSQPQVVYHNVTQTSSRQLQVPLLITLIYKQNFENQVLPWLCLFPKNLSAFDQFAFFNTCDKNVPKLLY